MLDISKYLSFDELRTLRNSAESWALLDLKHGRRQGLTVWIVVDLATSLGLRVSELAAITHEDINAKLRALRVTRRKRRKPIVETVPMPLGLAKHIAEYTRWKELANLPITGALVAGTRGALTARGWQQVWHSAVDRAGVRKVSIHAARHTLATLLLKQTKNLRLVQKQLGHASPASTAIYADVAFEDMQSALDTVLSS